jgi:hypothetical protein
LVALQLRVKEAPEVQQLQLAIRGGALLVVGAQVEQEEMQVIGIQVM